MNPRILSARAVLVGVFTFLFVLLVVGPRLAAAAEPAPAVKEPGESPQYRALLEEAVSEYDARRYEEARALFRRAHDLSPNARTLRGIGMASFELREYVEALRSLEGSLVDKRRPLTAVQRQQVEALLERTRAFVGRFFVKLSPKDTALRIDAAPATLESDGSLLLSFGRHAVVAEAPGSQPENREVNVIGGERQELSFQLRPVTLAAGGPSKPGTIAPPEGNLIGGGAGGGGSAPNAEASSSSAVWWYAGAGVAAAGAVGSYLWWRARSHQIDRCNAEASCDNLDSLSTERRIAIGTTIGAASAAAVMAIIGTVVWAGNKPEQGTALACGLDPGAVNCELKISF